MWITRATRCSTSAIPDAAGGLRSPEDLGNGIRVVLKPTDFNKDEIVFRGFLRRIVGCGRRSRGGANGRAGRCGQRSRRSRRHGAAERRLATAAVNAIVTEADVGVAGQASAKDLQTLFELIYLRFTAAGRRRRVFGVIRCHWPRQSGQQPVVALNDAFTRLMTQDHRGGL